MARRNKKHTHFAKALGCMLSEKGIGIREAGRIAGVSHTTLADWLDGGTPTDYMAVKKLAAHLGTTLSFLLTGEEDARITPPSVTEVFHDGGPLFDGFAKIVIHRLIPRTETKKE